MIKKDFTYDKEMQNSSLLVKEAEEINWLSPSEVQRNFSHERKNNESNYEYMKRMEAIEWLAKELEKGRKSGEEEGWLTTEEVRKALLLDYPEK